jgi:hypothetical protein
MTQIDLNDLTRAGEVRNLSGHEKGVDARRHYKLNELDRYPEPVLVLVPELVYTLTPSFFQGMFAESVRTLRTREEFLAHYRFNATPLILRQIERGISAAQMQRGDVLVS